MKSEVVEVEVVLELQIQDQDQEKGLEEVEGEE